MSKKRKIIATSLAAVLAVALAVGGTITYLSDSSDSVKNEFETNQNGVELKENTGEDYEIVPGTSQDKDPTITATYTLDSYVYVEVTDATNDLVEWYIANGWTRLDGASDPDSGVYVYYMLLKTADTAGWITVDNSESDYNGQATYTDSNGITYYYDSDSDTYTAVIPVLKDNQVSYSSTLTNADLKDADDISLTFQAYIIQAQLSGTTSNEADYADPTTAYNVVTTGSSVYYENATYVALDEDAMESLAMQLTNALSSATSSTTKVIVLPEDAEVSVTAAALNSAITGTAVIDLNDGSLNVSTASTVAVSDGADLTIANGTVETSLSQSATAAFSVNSESSLTLENVEMTTKGCAFYAQGDAAEVNVIDSTVTAYAYAVATNASSADNYNVVINIENSALNATCCAVLINVPCTLNISNSTVTGDTQALVVRAGTAKVTDTKLISTLSESKYGSGIWSTYDNKNWGDGNSVAFAPLTIGNRNGSYSGDAVVNLNGVTIEYNSDETDARGVYMYGGVTYPDTNTEPNKAILNYNSSNCTLGTIIQGETTYTVVNGTAN